MKATVEIGLASVTVLTYRSAKEAIAYTDTLTMLNTDRISNHQYIFALMEGCIEGIEFKEDFEQDGETLLLHQYWSGRNGDLSNNWEVFKMLPDTIVENFWGVYKSTRAELPKGNPILEETPNFDKEPETKEEKKSGKGGKKAT